MFRISLLFSLILILSSCTEKSSDPERPNIVLIFIDDLGFGDLGITGATGYETPQIDRLSKEGMMLTHFYAAQAVCSASRAALLTGCYPNRIGITGALNHSAQHGIHEEETTIAEMLKEVGYSTAIFGKWHLGHHKKFLPVHHGFDEYAGLPYSNDMWPVKYDGTPDTSGRKTYYPKLPFIEGDTTAYFVEDLKGQDQLTRTYTERSVEFIRENADNPFFLYVPHSMVHVPLGVSEQFRGKSDQGMYGDVMMEVDWSVGEIMKTLEEEGISENTLVIFTSDNGPWLNFGNHAGSSGGFREGKGTSWEGGQRVPCLVRWPAVVPEGVVADQLSATIDILPTIAAITGAPLPDRPIDGVNILPVLKGEKDVSPRDEFYFYYNRNDLEAVRKGWWKLVLPHSFRSYENMVPGNDGLPGPYARGRTEMALFDLRRDPGERYDLLDENPEIVEELMVLVNNARQDLGDNLTDNEGSNRREPGWVGEGARVRKIPADHKGTEGSIKYITRPRPQYSAGGDNALNDGKAGSGMDFHRNWQGWQGDDVEIIIEWPEGTSISEVNIGFLRNQGSWIFFPTMVSLEYSEDGSAFSLAETKDIDAGLNETFSKVEEVTFTLEESAEVRSIRIIARNLGILPEWHPGAGEKAWVFVDEIVVR